MFIHDSDAFLFITILLLVEHILSPHRYISWDKFAFNKSSSMLTSSGEFLSSRTFRKAVRAYISFLASSGYLAAKDC